MKKLLLLALLIPASALADTPPDPGPIQPAPPIACMDSFGYHPAITTPVVIPSGAGFGCSEFIIFGDINGYTVLPPLWPFSREQLQFWADDAFGSDANTNAHYAASWWNRFEEQKFCGLR